MKPEMSHDDINVLIYRAKVMRSRALGQLLSVGVGKLRAWFFASVLHRAPVRKPMLHA